MRCPYCNEEMQQGYLQTGQRIAWTKKIHKISLLPKDGEVLFANNTIRGTSFQAYICKGCKKVLFDYSDKEVTEG